MIKSRIAGTGSYLPEKRLTNFDIEKLVDTSAEWIVERTGIHERRVAEKGVAASDLAFEASKAAMKRAGIKGKDLDMIICGTVTGDMPFPSTACVLQSRLEATNAAAFDVSAACSGFMYGLFVADSFIRSGARKKILLVGVDMLSRVTDWDDRSTCIIFGDGAGAVIIEQSKDDSGIMSVDIGSDGSLWDFLYIPGCGSRIPISHDCLDKKLQYVRMRGNETFKIAVKTLETIVLETLKKSNLKPSQLSLLIPHQANLRIIQATAKKLDLPMEKVMVNIDKYGNTSSASIPIALDEALSSGRIRTGDFIMMEAFGAGLTWGSALVKW
jgi:3-oxoacyl-[acyl-carrier-protein] synthase III